jgi:hypothetical protein
MKPGLYEAWIFVGLKYERKAEQFFIRYKVAAREFFSKEISAQRIYNAIAARYLSGH